MDFLVLIDQMIYHQRMGLAKWFESQPDGAMTRMLHDLLKAATPVSWATICRAKRGEPISEKSAKIISAYTKRTDPTHKVSVESLTKGGGDYCSKCGRPFAMARKRRGMSTKAARPVAARASKGRNVA